MLLFSHATPLSCQFALFVVLAESAFCDMLEELLRFCQN